MLDGRLGIRLGGAIGEPGFKLGGEAETTADAGEDAGDTPGAEAGSDRLAGFAGGMAAHGDGEGLAEDDKAADEGEYPNGARVEGGPALVRIGGRGWLGAGCRGGHGRK